MPMTNIDIQRTLGHVEIPSHVLQRHAAEGGGTLVANLEDYFDGTGSHWVAVYSGEKDYE